MTEATVPRRPPLARRLAAAMSAPWPMTAVYGAAAAGSAALAGPPTPPVAALWGLVALAGLARHVLHVRLRALRGQPLPDDLPDLLFVVDQDGRLLGWNRRAGQVTGLPASARGGALVDAVPTTDRTTVHRALSLALADGHTAFEARLRTADGTSLPCLWLAAPWRPAGGPAGLVVSARDNGAGHKRRRELEDRERRFRHMVEMAPHMVAVAVRDSLDYVNAAGARLLGLDDPAAALGQSWSEGFRPAGDDGIDRVLRPDGTLVDVEVSAVPILFNGQTATLIEARDVTEINRAHRAVRESEQILQGVMDTAVDAILTTDAAGIIGTANLAAERLFGWSARELAGRDVWQLMPDLALERPGPPVAGLARTAATTRETTGRRHDGGEFPVEVAIGAMHPGDQPMFSVVIRDIGDMKRDHARLVIAQKVFESTSEGVMVTDGGGTVLWVNHAFCTISGYARQEVIGQNASLLKSGFQGGEFYAEMWRHIRQDGQWSGEIWNRRKDGEAYAEWLTIKAVPDSGREPRYVGIFSDISKHKRAEETIKHLTYYDAVTRLPNRYLFEDRLSQAIERAQRNQRQVALVLLSLDRFKTVNETLGHQTGDALLRLVAERMQGAIRGADTVARMRGDTFCCVLTDLTQGHDANPVIARLMEAFNASFELGGHELFITTSVGISLFPLDGRTTDEMIQKAEAAMNRSKDKAENTYHFYTPEMNANTMERLQLETNLRKAIGQDDFVLHYQPKIETGTGRLIGAEALIRWNHPELGLVPPVKFIPIAEETGLIIGIGNWVLATACRQIRAWREAGLTPVRIAINISALHFQQPDLVEAVVRVLEETGIDAQWIELELTESAVMRNADSTIQTLMKLHEHGIKLSIDDFGTGYSSLSYLKRFPIDTLKIDRSFVQDLGPDTAGEEIVGAIIAMAHSLSMSVVAEGVETEFQLAVLERLKCDQIQGYYYSKPVPADRFADFLAEGVPVKSTVAA